MGLGSNLCVVLLVSITDDVDVIQESKIGGGFVDNQRLNIPGQLSCACPRTCICSLCVCDEYTQRTHNAQHTHTFGSCMDEYARNVPHAHTQTYTHSIAMIHLLPIVM